MMVLLLLHRGKGDEVVMFIRKNQVEILEIKKHISEKNSMDSLNSKMPMTQMSP